MSYCEINETRWRINSQIEFKSVLLSNTITARVTQQTIDFLFEICLNSSEVNNHMWFWRLGAHYYFWGTSQSVQRRPVEYCFRLLFSCYNNASNNTRSGTQLFLHWFLYAMLLLDLDHRLLVDPSEVLFYLEAFVSCSSVCFWHGYGILCQNGDCRVVDRSQLSKQNVGFNQSCNALREKVQHYLWKTIWKNNKCLSPFLCNFFIALRILYFEMQRNYHI